MRIKLIFFVVALLTSLANAAPAHVHGVGRLDIVIDGTQLSISLELPLESVVGFEHPPRTIKEKAAIAAMSNTLNDAASLFSPTIAAGCQLKSAHVNIPFSATTRSKRTDDHADIDADYVFQCLQPSALKSLETTIFKSFPRLMQLDASRAGPTGQGGGRLTAKTPNVRW